MRQAGVIAAAGIFALENMIQRLEKDHATARRLAEIILGTRGISLNLESVQTNIVRFDISPCGLDSLQFAQGLAKRGVKLHCLTNKHIRAVMHRGITMKDVEKAGKEIRDFCLRL